MTQQIGLNIHLPHNTASEKTLDRTIELVVESGVDWVRLDFNWDQMEPREGDFRWRATDAVVNACHNGNLAMFPTLAYTPAWASSNGQGRLFPPENADLYPRFITAVVQRYANKIRHWGIWNEPNLRQFYRGSRSEYLERILVPGVEAVKAADPNAMVLGPDLSHNKFTWQDFAGIGTHKSQNWSYWLEDILKAAKGGIDILTHHVYKDRGEKAWRFIDGSPWPWEGPSLFSKLNQLGFNKEVWITETGWRARSTSQANEQARHYQSFLNDYTKPQHAGVRNVIFYEFMDDAINDTNLEGVVYGGGKSAGPRFQPKPAFHKLKGWRA